MSTPAAIKPNNLPTVALVGRVNVGKSTLFNRLTEKNQALVSAIPGTTRTNNEGLVLWRGKYFKLIDTGGLTFDEKIHLETDIIKQSEKAMAEADIIIMVADARDGVLPQEKELAKRVRRLADKPILFIANKADSNKIARGLYAPEWLRLGLGEPLPVSAANGRNTGDLLDAIFKKLKKLKKNPKTKTAEKEIIQVCLIGKPNVGKSSLFNKLIGQEKVIVSPIAHTTREPHDTLVSYEEKINDKNETFLINFIDTAGIRRKANVAGELEQKGIGKSIEALEKSDICLFVVDGAEPISSQDQQLGGLLERHGKSVIILINKWDLAEDNSDHQRNEVKKMIYNEFPHLRFAPIMFISGKTGYRVHDIFPPIIHAWNSRHIIIPEEALRAFLRQLIKTHRPARGKGVRQPEIVALRQIGSNPPVMNTVVKAKTSLHRSYVNFIENKLREQFDFFATPVIIKLSKNKKL
ncbi:MAG: ribosome biogenesis GTPase Der [Candidatus Magasanikbacteria bacterium]|nr:ribosome biogenesis GTPase Der [Candidatus Magasanikbacteria bacterium]